MAKGNLDYSFGRRPKRMQPKGEYNEERAMWAKFGINEVVLYFDAEGPQVGSEVVLTFYKGRRSFALNLCEMTEADLDAFKAVLNRALDTALPVIRERDRIAQDDFDNGIDTNPRSYRQLPQLVTRERVFEQHGPRISCGPDGVPRLDLDGRGGDSAAGTPDGDVRPDGGGIPELDSEGLGTEDDVSEADEPA